MNGTIENHIMLPNGNDVQQIMIIPEVQPNKQKRKKSEVWQYFTAQPVSDDCTRASCNQCSKSFAYINGKKHSGTSHLRRHISSGACPPKHHNQNTEPLFPFPTSSQNISTAPPRKRCRASPGSATFELDQEHCNHEIARMIIHHDYLTSMMAKPNFVEFVRTFQPDFSMATFNSIQSEIVTIYRREKHSLVNVIEKIPSRVSLTLDFWSTDQNLGYAMLTSHFVDAHWKLQRRVLNFILVPFPDSEVAFNNAIVTCMSDWKFESKLFGFTLDQSFANEAVVGNIRGLLSLSNSHMHNGRFLMVNCYAHVINRLAQEALASMSAVVGKVRDSVKFVLTLQSREEKFNELRQQLQVPCTGNLIIDNRGKWDSTYHMLSTACELKEVFNCLDTSDPNYNLAPSMDEWKAVEALCACLEYLFEGANILMAQTYPAAHKFFHQAYKIRFGLVDGASSDDPIVSNLVRPLLDMYDLYWRDRRVVLAMAAVMDPRYKLKLVGFTLTSLSDRYREEEGDTWVRNIEQSLHDLYFEYVAQSLPLPSIHVEQRYDEFMKAESHQEDASDFDVFLDISSNNQTKSELDQYLEEEFLPSDEFDVFDWWKLNRVKYPTLSQMAADLLSIPFGIVRRDSVFDTEARKVDSHRCSLRPSTLEAIVCANDWLDSGMKQSTSMFDSISPLMVKTENQNLTDNEV